VSYSEFITEDRRLAVLRLLADQQDYALNDSVLHGALGRLGHGVARDLVRDDIAWLREHGLVSVEIVAERVWVARLTERGADCAAGRTRVPGVKRPGPRG
jgi:hypothetical protein